MFSLVSRGPRPQCLEFQNPRNELGGDSRTVPHRRSHLVEADVMPLPVEDPHLLDSSVTVPRTASVEFQTFSNHQRTGSLNSAGTDIRHCSPAQIMNPQRASMLWQFANGSFLHLTSWNPFTQPGQMYPWVIIKPIYDQSYQPPTKAGYFDAPQYPWDRRLYYWPEHKGTCDDPRD